PRHASTYRVPLRHPSAGEVAAATHQGYAASKRQGIALPQADAWIRPHDPLPVGGVQVNGSAAEGMAPLHHRGIVVRMGDGDGGNAAETLHDLDRGGIDERDAVPQEVAAPRAQQPGAPPE